MRRRQVTAAALAIGVALVAFLTPSSLSAASGTLAIGSASTFRTGEVTVELVADVDQPGLGAWTIDVAYDPEILSARWCVEAYIDPPGMAQCYAYRADAMRATGISASGLEGPNVLAKIALTCRTSGMSPLALDVRFFEDATIDNPTPIDVTVTDGWVTCVERGDVDCSGTVDPRDALALLQFAAGLTAAPLCPQFSDFDQNGVLDTRDAFFILHLVAFP